MRDCVDGHDEVPRLHRAHVAKHLAERTFRLHGRLVQLDRALDHHLGVRGNPDVGVLGLHHFDGLAAHATGNRQLVGRQRLGGEAPGREAGAAQHPDDRILAEHDGVLHRLLATFPGGHQHLVAGLVGLRVDAELAGTLDLATVGAEVRAELGVHHEVRAGVDVAATIGRVGLDEGELRDVDVGTVQHDFLHRRFVTRDLHGRDFRERAAMLRQHVLHVTTGGPIGLVVITGRDWQAPDDRVGVPVALGVDDDGALDPLAVDLHFLEQHRGRAVHREALGGAEKQGGDLELVLVDAFESQQQAVGLQRGDPVAEGVEGCRGRGSQSGGGGGGDQRDGAGRDGSGRGGIAGGSEGRESSAGSGAVEEVPA